MTSSTGSHRPSLIVVTGPSGAGKGTLIRKLLERVPDLEVTVQALPEGTKDPPAVKLAYFVDAAGNPSACTALPDSKVQPKLLVDAACAQLFGKLARTPVTAAGAAVPAVKTAAVLFTKGE